MSLFVLVLLFLLVAVPPFSSSIEREVPFLQDGNKFGPLPSLLSFFLNANIACNTAGKIYSVYSCCAQKMKSFELFAMCSPILFLLVCVREGANKNGKKAAGLSKALFPSLLSTSVRFPIKDRDSLIKAFYSLPLLCVIAKREWLNFQYTQKY